MRREELYVLGENAPPDHANEKPDTSLSDDCGAEDEIVVHRLVDLLRCITAEVRLRSARNVIV
jgi:hypothetical protein